MKAKGYLVWRTLIRLETDSATNLIIIGKSCPILKMNFFRTWKTGRNSLDPPGFVSYYSHKNKTSSQMDGVKGG